MGARLVLGLAALLGAILALAVAAPARADVFGVVVNQDGLPIPEVSVNAALGGSAGTTDELGNYSVEVPTNRAPPYKIAFRYTDFCAGPPDPIAELLAASDPFGLPLVVMQATALCAARLPPPPPVPRGAGIRDLEGTGAVFPTEGILAQTVGGKRGSVVVGINDSGRYDGSTVHVRASMLPRDAAGVIAEGDGGSKKFGSSDLEVLERERVTITCDEPYFGRLDFSFSVGNGPEITSPLGTLVCLDDRHVQREPLDSYPMRDKGISVAVILDESQKEFADFSGRRRNALQFLTDRLSHHEDSVAIIGFDDEARVLRPNQRIGPVGSAPRKFLRRDLGRLKLRNGIGRPNVDEDFDGALRASFDQLGGETNAARKGQIFLAQAERDMPYLNSHLRLALDASKVVDPDTSDPPLEPSFLAPIPTCAIERKASETGDTAVLTRMAEQTGGYFVRAPPNQDLLVAFFRCVNRFFGYAEATSVLTSHTTQKPWDSRLFGRRIRLDRGPGVGRRSFESSARRIRFLITADRGGRGGPLTGIGLRLGKRQNAKLRRVNTRKNGFLALKRLRAIDRIPGIEINLYPAARGDEREVSIRSWKDAVEILVDLRLHPRGTEIQVRARKGRVLRLTAMKWAPGIAARNPR